MKKSDMRVNHLRKLVDAQRGVATIYKPLVRDIGDEDVALVIRTFYAAAAAFRRGGNQSHFVLRTACTLAKVLLDDLESQGHPGLGILILSLQEMSEVVSKLDAPRFDTEAAAVCCCAGQILESLLLPETLEPELRQVCRDGLNSHGDD